MYEDIMSYITTAKNLNKQLKTEETYKTSIVLQIIKNGQVDTQKLKAYGERNQQFKYVENVFKYSEELEDRGVLSFNEQTATFEFVSEEAKRNLYNQLKKELDELQAPQSQTSSNDDSFVIKNSYIQDRLRQAYESLDLRTLDAKRNFIKSMTYFNNFSFNNVISLHSQLEDANESFYENVRFYKTFAHYKKQGTRVLKGSKALRAIVPNKMPMYEKDANGNFIEENGQRVPMLDSNGKRKFATTFSMTNIFEFSQTNFDIDYLQSDKYEIAGQLASKAGHTYSPVQNPVDFLSSMIREELEKVSEDATTNRMATFILLNRLGFGLNDANITKEIISLNQEDFLTLSREANTLARSYERKYNFDEILQNATHDNQRENILETYSTTSRAKRIEFAEQLDREIKSRILKLKESIDIANHVEYDMENGFIIGASIFGIEDKLNDINSYIDEIKASEDYKAFDLEKNEALLEELVDTTNSEAKKRDVFIKTEDKDLASVAKVEKKTSQADVYSDTSTVYSSYDQANKFKEDLQRGSEESQNVLRDAKLAKIKAFISDAQFEILSTSSEMNETINELYSVIVNTPKTYATDELPENETMVKMHYFNSGSDWYIIEKDMYEEQRQAYGFVVLNGDLQNAELGYIDIDTLRRMNVELDFHWRERSLEQLKNELFNDDTQESDQESTQRFGAGNMGGVDTVVWDRLAEENGEYKTVGTVHNGVGRLYEAYKNDNEAIEALKRYGATSFAMEKQTITTQTQQPESKPYNEAEMSAISYVKSMTIDDVDVREVDKNLSYSDLIGDSAVIKFITDGGEIVINWNENTDTVDVETDIDVDENMALEIINSRESIFTQLREATNLEETNESTQVERYYYGMAHRPPSLGAVPNGYRIEEESTADFDYGVISYERELSAQELDSFELVAISDKQIDYVAEKTIEAMGRHKESYLDNTSAFDSFMHLRGVTGAHSMRVEPSKQDELKTRVLEKVRAELQNSVEAVQSQAPRSNYVERLLRLQPTFDALRAHYGKAWPDELRAMWETGVYDSWLGDKVPDLQFLRNNFYNLDTLLEDNVITNEQYLSIVYPFMDDEDKEEHRELISTTFDERYKNIVEHFKSLGVLEDKGEGYDYSVLEYDSETTNGSTVTYRKSMSFFGIEDTFKPLDAYIDELKNTDNYQNLLKQAPKQDQANAVDVWIDSFYKKAVEVHGDQVVQEAMNSGKLSIQQIGSDSIAIRNHSRGVVATVEKTYGIREAITEGFVKEVFNDIVNLNTQETTLTRESVIQDVKMLRDYINSLEANAKYSDVLSGTNSTLYSTYLFMNHDNTFEHLTVNEHGGQTWESLSRAEAINTLERAYKPQLVSSWGLRELENDAIENTTQTHKTAIKTEKIGAKTKFRRNMEALEVIERLENGTEVEELTKKDLQRLSLYTGWGGIPQAFRKYNGEVTKGWESEVEELESLLPKEKLEEIRRTVLTSFYTPTQVSDSVMRGIEEMGYNGYGNILEPSVGIGNFLSSFSTTVNQGSKIDAIEMDKTTAKITKALFPHVTMTTKPYQDVEIKDGKYNLIVGNPPFGDISITDNDKDLHGKTLHNYFLAKSSKKLAEGGLMAMVVSANFMDAKDASTREVIADTCNLVGAIRLPNNAFGDTQVTTDVLFFQKRTSEMQSNADEWVEVSELNETQINKYYTIYQDKLLGKWGKFGTMYGGGQPALVADKDQDTIALLNAEIDKLPRGIYSKINAQTIDVSTVETETIEMSYSDHPKLADAEDYTYQIVDDKLMMKLYDSKEDNRVVLREVKTRYNSTMQEIPLKEKEIERIKAITELVETAEELRDAQLRETVSDAQLDAQRATLNETYDAFVKKYRYLNADINKRLFRDDTRFAFALSLERDYKKAITKKEAETKGLTPSKESAKKADIFKERTQYPYRLPTKADNSLDALTISLAELGQINLRYMSGLTGHSEDKLIDDLVTVDAIYKDPTIGWVTKEEYLSGDVKTKLKQATEERNIKALEKVIPKDLEAHEISISCGASWLPDKYMAQFAEYISGDKRANAIYAPAIASWKINCHATDSSMQYATERRTVSQILEASANNVQIKIYDKKQDGSQKLNEVQSQLANDKVEKVKEQFTKWIYQDDERREDLVKIYNEKFNRMVNRKYNGDILPLRGQADTIELRKHQKDFVRKFVEGKGVNLADHSVGTGKTFTAITCTMEAKRMNRANKALVVVPNHLTEEWGSQWLGLYPNANILVATEKDFSTKERPVFLNRIATGKWDAVVIGHSQLAKIGVSKEYQEQFINEQIADLNTSLQILEEQDGKSFTTKQIEAKVQKLEEKLKKLLNQPVETTMSDLGIDMLVVDEAHKFKNLAYSTSLTSVGSLGNPAGSNRAEDLYLKTQSLLDRTHGRNLLFLTGTPISNSIAEMYTVQRYLQSDGLREMGLSHFDSWAKQYAEVVTEFELKANGQYEPKARLSKFNNVPDLIQQYNTFADVVSRDDVVKDAISRGVDLQIPRIRGGRPTNIVLDRSEIQAQMIGIEDEDGNYNSGSLIDRAIRMQGKKAEKGGDNILVIINDSKQIALDPRIKNPMLPDDENSKVNVMIEHSLELYHKYNEDKGTMLIFCDQSIPKGNAKSEKAKLEELFRLAEEGEEEQRLKAEEELSKMSTSEIDAIMSDNDFSVYDDIKAKLIAKGVPEREIVFIHDAKTNQQKQAIFDKVNRGEIRYLLGSTSKMGEGMNVQERLVGLFHLDAPWRPSDIEQREGRIIRQGNKLQQKYGDDFEVVIERFATKGTLDSTMWETLERKQLSIEQIKKGDASQRSVDDIGSESATMSDMKASASGNPYILEEVKLKREIRKLENIQDEHDRNQFKIRDKIRYKKLIIESAENTLSNAKADKESGDRYINTLNNNALENDDIRVENKRIKEENKKIQKENKTLEKEGKPLKPLLEEKPLKPTFLATLNGVEVNSRSVIAEKIDNIVGDIMLGKQVSTVDKIKFGDFDISFEYEKDHFNLLNSNLIVIVEGKEEYTINVPLASAKGEGICTRIKNTINMTDVYYKGKLEEIEKAKRELPKLEESLGEFEREDELQTLKKRYTVVTNSLKYKRDNYHQEAVKQYTVDRIESEEERPKIYRVVGKDNTGKIHEKSVMTDNKELAIALYKSSLSGASITLDEKQELTIHLVAEEVQDRSINVVDDALYHQGTKVDTVDPFYVIHKYIDNKHDDVVSNQDVVHTDVHTNNTQKESSVKKLKN